MSSVEKKQSSSLMMMMSLPDEIIVDIIAHVPRLYHPTLSLVSKRFRSLAASRELYARRSLWGCGEPCLYVALYDDDTEENRLYILLQTANGFHLVPIPSLPAMPYRGTFVAVGSKIYVFGIHEALSVDCTSHTVNSLPDLPMPMINKVADFIDGKIYVIGRIESESGLLYNRVMVFDTETQMWNPQLTEPDMEIGAMYPSCVVMADKMYMSDYKNSFVYGPKSGIWETEGMLHSEGWQYACVVDEILFYYDEQNKALKAYDIYQRCWRVVKGVKELLPEAKELLPEGAEAQWSSQTVSYGGRLAVFLSLSYDLSQTNTIWCVEISIEQRQGGEIWGKVERRDVVTDGHFTLMTSLHVMV